MPATPLTAPLPTLEAWIRRLRDANLPVLASTAEELDLLALVEDTKGTVDAHLIGEAIEGDPLMTVKLLSYLGQHRHPKQNGETETPVAAVMMMGIGPFFATFRQLERVETRLASQAEALSGVRQILRRAHRAARFALCFAIHRQDTDAMAVHEAALLYDIAQMILWIEAPALAAEIEARHRADPHARTADLQLSVLNVRLADLQQGLLKAWKFPTLLIQLMDTSQEHALIAPQRRMVQLAVRLARHSEVNWLDAALPDDVRDIAELLTLSINATQRLLHSVDS